jgi:hypothetical protein
MQTALIIMTILGCDDSATQCHYVEMLDERWATIQECDAHSEDRLRGYANIDYPVVVAVCQTPGDSGIEEAAAEQGQPLQDTDSMAPAVQEALVPQVDIPAENTEQAQLSDDEAEAGLAARMLKRVQDALPDAESIKSLVTEPVHVVTDSYSWVARRFEK